MNYYPFHVGDYAAHTAHLDLLEDLAYRRMLDLYYLRECALPHDPAEVARLIRMRGNVAEVTAVLREFFTEFEGGWVNGRCEEEILRMKDKQTKAKASAEASVAARRAKAEGHRSTPAERTLNERSTDAELPTPTPTPTPNIKNTSAVALPDGVSQSVWSDFIALRKAKKAKLTDTAIARLRCEAESAGWTLEAALSECCARGWVGFKAEWVAKQSHGPLETFAERDERNAKEKWQRMTGQQHPDLTNGLPQHLNIIEADTVRIAA